MPEKITLYQQVSSAANVLAATHNTLKHGRRYKGAGAAFSFNKEQQVITIVKELQSKTYKPGRYEQFFIYEPKKREVLAAPLKDRVVHHALHDVVEPLIDRKFIFDSYACRKNKGTHKAILRAQRFLQSNVYFVHLDVKKYFPSIDHLVLTSILRKHFYDTEVLKLFDLIIESSLPQQEKRYDLFNPASDSKGLPIGNLTSQFLANLYLNELDQHIKHELKCHAYLRYMDDFVLFHNDRNTLNTLRKLIHQFCEEQLHLSLHEKGGVKHYSEGLGFLGFKIYRTYRLLKGVCLNRFMRKYKGKQKQVVAGKLDQMDLQHSVISWQNHLMHGDTQGLKTFLSKKYQIQFRKEALHE
jgi:retron-type reverse transcriptase